MIFIGGISSGTKGIIYDRRVMCPCCGIMSQIELVMTYTYFSFFFIPLFKWNRRFLVRFSCCGSIYELDREKGMVILRGGDADISPSDLVFMEGPSAAGGRTCGTEERENSSDQRYCAVCGRQIEKDFEFCPYCGGRL